jgi:putative component of membrane protein insertase Oxa1/YidC/SpoIIIJ protein YidD
MEDKDFMQVRAYSSSPIPETEEFVPYNPLNRPPMHYTKPIIALLIFIAQFVGLCLIPLGAWWIRALVLLGYSILYGAVIAKRAVIWMVHLYQNKASDETRLKCAFEPSCSEYMILAVRKYGVIRGVCKGIHRLRRCGKEHGIDYP